MGYLQKNSVYVGLILLLLVQVGCGSSDEGDPCRGYDAFVPLQPNRLIDVYADEPTVRYVRTRNEKVYDTLTFATRLDTVYEEYGRMDSEFPCGWCYSVYEIVELHFEGEASDFEMGVSFVPCVEYFATINGSRYIVEYRWQNDHVFGFDSLRMDDTQGLYYFAKDSQYQLTLLP